LLTYDEATYRKNVFSYKLDMSNVNLNTLTKNGFYFGYKNMVNAPTEENLISVLFIVSYTDDWLYQFFAVVSGAPEIYVRTKYDGLYWSSWKVINVTTK
jgi:hypothetical protein